MLSVNGLNYKVITSSMAFIIFRYAAIVGCILGRYKEGGH